MQTSNYSAQGCDKNSRNADYSLHEYMLHGSYGSYPAIAASPLAQFSTRSVVAAKSVSIQINDQSLDIKSVDTFGRDVSLYHDIYTIFDMPDHAYWELYDKYNVRMQSFGGVMQPEIQASLNLRPDFYRISSRQFYRALADVVESMQTNQRLKFGGFDISKGKKDEFSVLMNSDFLQLDQALRDDLYSRNRNLGDFRKSIDLLPERALFLPALLSDYQTLPESMRFVEHVISQQHEMYVKPSNRSSAESVFKLVPKISKQKADWLLSTADEGLLFNLSGALGEKALEGQKNTRRNTFVIPAEQLADTLMAVIGFNKKSTVWIAENSVPQFDRNGKHFEFRMVFERAAFSWKFCKELSICKRSQSGQLFSNLCKGADLLSVEQGIQEIFQGADTNFNTAVLKKLKHVASGIATDRLREERSLRRKLKLPESGLHDYLGVDLVFSKDLTSLYLMEIQLGPGIGYSNRHLNY